MHTNELPRIDTSDNPTGCCPRFDPDPWDGRDLHFKDKLFLRAETTSVLYIPVNMERVFEKTFADIEKAGAYDPNDFVVLSRTLSPWKSEHLFAVAHEVPGRQTVRLSGDFVTKTFEGPYREAPIWIEEMRGKALAAGLQPIDSWIFYTTCPKCAKFYGKNHAVGLLQVEPVHAAV